MLKDIWTACICQRLQSNDHVLLIVMGHGKITVENILEWLMQKQSKTQWVM